MNIFSAIFYLTSLFLLHLSFIVAYPNFDYKILMNEYGFFALITSLSLSLINFSLKEIIDSFKTIIFAKKVSELDFKQNELVINSIWKYIFYTSVLYSIIVSVIFLSQPDKYVLGKYLANLLGIIFFTLFTKVFIFKPLEISILRRNVLDFKKYSKKIKSDR